MFFAGWLMYFIFTVSFRFPPPSLPRASLLPIRLPTYLIYFAVFSLMRLAYNSALSPPSTLPLSPSLAL